MNASLRIYQIFGICRRGIAMLSSSPADLKSIIIDWLKGSQTSEARH
jgi:hypothetical protein